MVMALPAHAISEPLGSTWRVAGRRLEPAWSRVCGICCASARHPDASIRNRDENEGWPHGAEASQASPMSPLSLPSATSNEIHCVRQQPDDDVEQYYDLVYSFVRRRSASPEDAEDLTQTVFADASARLGTLQSSEHSVLAWLYTVARRRLIDEHRRRSRRGVTTPITEADEASDSGEYSVEIRDALKAALNDIPVTQRELVVYRLIDGLSFAEIASLTGISEAACKMRFSRGLANVRIALQKEGIAP